MRKGTWSTVNRIEDGARSSGASKNDLGSFEKKSKPPRYTRPSPSQVLYGEVPRNKGTSEDEMIGKIVGPGNDKYKTIKNDAGE